MNSYMFSCVFFLTWIIMTTFSSKKHKNVVKWFSALVNILGCNIYVKLTGVRLLMILLP